MNLSLSILLFCLLMAGVFAFFTSCKNPMGNTNKESSGKLDYGFSKSGDTILYNNTLLEVDASSFTILDEHFCKDKSYVYYHDSYRDSRDYFISKKYHIQKLEKADAATFVSLGYGFGKDKSQAWLKEKSFHVADIDGLTAIDHQFVKDGIHAYFLGKEIKGSDGKTFERIDSFYAKDSNKYYFIESDQVNYNIQQIVCDRSTFKILEYPYSQDQDRVYYEGKIFKDAQARSFQIIKYPYSKDEQYVYYENKIINGADPKSFDLFIENELSSGESYYGKDKNNIYINATPFTGVDPVTFRILDEKYTIDKNGVYYRMKKVKNADPTSFKVYPHYMGDADAEDKHHKFGDGKIVE